MDRTTLEANIPSLQFGTIFLIAIHMEDNLEKATNVFDNVLHAATTTGGSV